jgi:hypothetical protein
MHATCVGRDPGNKMQRIDAVRIFVAPATNDGSVNRKYLMQIFGL